MNRSSTMNPTAQQFRTEKTRQILSKSLRHFFLLFRFEFDLIFFFAAMNFFRLFGCLNLFLTSRCNFCVIKAVALSRILNSIGLFVELYVCAHDTEHFDDAFEIAYTSTNKHQSYFYIRISMGQEMFCNRVRTHSLCVDLFLAECQTFAAIYFWSLSSLEVLVKDRNICRCDIFFPIAFRFSFRICFCFFFLFHLCDSIEFVYILFSDVFFFRCVRSSSSFATIDLAKAHRAYFYRN